MDVPQVSTLRDAVAAVVRNNAENGYPPTRFVQTTEGLNGADLVAAADHLVRSDTAKTALLTAFEQHANLWTLEDFVASWGRDWGVSAAAWREAASRVELFDTVRKFYRRRPVARA